MTNEEKFKKIYPDAVVVEAKHGFAVKVDENAIIEFGTGVTRAKAWRDAFRSEAKASQVKASESKSKDMVSPLEAIEPVIQEPINQEASPSVKHVPPIPTAKIVKVPRHPRRLVVNLNGSKVYCACPKSGFWKAGQKVEMEPIGDINDGKDRVHWRTRGKPKSRATRLIVLPPAEG